MYFWHFFDDLLESWLAWGQNWMMSRDYHLKLFSQELSYLNYRIEYRRKPRNSDAIFAAPSLGQGRWHHLILGNNLWWPQATHNSRRSSEKCQMSWMFLNSVTKLDSKMKSNFSILESIGWMFSNENFLFLLFLFLHKFCSHLLDTDNCSKLKL